MSFSRKYVALAMDSYILDRQEEYRLFELYKEQGCLKSRDAILKAYLKFVVSLAGELAKSKDETLFDELIGEGNLALVNAINSYDLDFGNGFAVYARKYILGAMNHYFIDKRDLVRIALTKEHRKLYYSIHAFKFDGAAPTAQEIKNFADLRGVSVTAVKEMMVRTRALSTLTFSPDPFKYDDGIASDSISYTIDENSNFSSLLSEFSEFKYQTDLLEQFLLQIPEREADVVRSRYLMEKKATLAELGERFGISYERISQLEKRAIIKIREMFKSVIHFEDGLHVPIVC